jgi:hypothetical protein
MQVLLAAGIDHGTPPGSAPACHEVWIADRGILNRAHPFFNPALPALERFRW